MRAFILFSFTALCALGQPTGLQVSQITNTGAALCYTAEDTMTSYAVEVSKLADFSTLVHDVDPALFSNAGTDLSRPDTVVAGTNRCVQIGHTGHFFLALDGSRRDRVLQTYTTYYWRIGGVSGTPFTTANIPMNIVNTQALDVRAPLVNNRPSLNPNYQSEWRDPWTGALVQVLPDWNKAWGGITAPTGIAMDLAEGTSWSASSGTLPDAIDTDDNVYAETSAEGEWLFLGLGDVNSSKVPHSSSYNDSLSYQNLLLRADCSGAGCGSGVDAEICLTFDAATCASAVKIFAVTSTEAEIRLCHPENPASACPIADDPGDIWAIDSLEQTDWSLAKGLIWNGATAGCSNTPTLCFKVQADCERLRVNDMIRWWFGGNAQARITAVSCGSTPPRVTLNDSWPADNNGSTGIPFMYANGLVDNQRYGFLVRKKTAVAGATLRIDSVRWIAAARAVVTNIAHGSGGYVPRCQEESLRTPGGRLFCAGSQGIWAFKDLNGELDAKYMGFSSFSLPGAQAVLYSPEIFTWSVTEVGVFYVIGTAVSGNSPASGVTKRYVFRIQFNHPDLGCGDPGTTCLLPSLGYESVGGPLDISATNLTPCLNSCSSTADDYTLDGQALRLDPTYNFARFGGPGLRAVQGNYLILSSREGSSQDTFAEYWAFDMGNGGIPASTYVGNHGNTQQLFSHNRTYASPGFRWAGDHTFQPVLGTDSHTVIEAGEKAPYEVVMDNALPGCTLSSSDCDICPSITVDGYDFTGKNRCASVTLSSAWNMAWETQPGAFESGDPVQGGSCSLCSPAWHWLQKLQVGDRLTTGATGTPSYETIKLIQRNSNSSWVVERGCGTDQSYASPKSHGAGTIWLTKGATTEPVCAVDPVAHFTFGEAWDFKNDTDGSNTHWDYFVNHAFSTPNVRVNGGYETQVNVFTNVAAAYRNAPVVSPIAPNGFAGITGAPGVPNAVEHHPSYQNYAAVDTNERRWYGDAHPLSFFDDGMTATSVGGSLYYLANANFPLAVKKFPLGAFQGIFPFQRTSVIDGTAAHWGQWCYALAGGDCFSGSTAGRLYVNGPMDTSRGCAGIEFWSGQLDTCAGNVIGKAGSSAAQTRIPPDSTTQLSNNHFRQLTKDITYRASATANIRPMPDGKWFFHRQNVFAYGISTFGKIPPFPVDDGIDRTTFLPRTITISSGSVPMGTVKARLKFGYDETFRCNENTDNACFAVEATVNQTVPFLWEPELTSGVGVACSSGCTIALPQIEGRIARYQVVFVNGSGVPVGSGPISFDIGSLPTAAAGTRLKIFGPARSSGVPALP